MEDNTSLSPRDAPQSELLPCPFCGETMGREIGGARGRRAAGIRHPKNNCLLSGYGWVAAHLERWNRRAALAQPKEQT